MKMTPCLVCTYQKELNDLGRLSEYEGETSMEHLTAPCVTNV